MQNLTTKQIEQVKRTGEKAPDWKGERAGKSAKHKWLDVYFGKPQNCEKCKRTNQKRYDWALIHGGQYTHNRSDYMRLCRSCHHKYDKIVNNKGSKHLWAKLTEKQVLDIRKRYVKGKNTKELSDQFGIARQTVRRIARRECWKQI